MLGLYHLFFPLSQGRDESEKENNKKRIAKKKENNNKRIKKKKESEKDSGLEPISPGTCQRQLSVTKRVYLFCRFLTSVVYCA